MVPHKTICLVSDLWGSLRNDWFHHFKSQLPSKYQLLWMDAGELGEIDNNLTSQEERHQQFIHFGIEKASQKLIDFKETMDLFIGCSIGGLLLWKAAQTNLNISKLVGLSSTRLRYETNSPPCEFSLYFGASDLHLPSPDWLNSVGKMQCQILPGDHEFYRDPQHIAFIIKDLKNKKWIDQE